LNYLIGSAGSVHARSYHSDDSSDFIVIAILFLRFLDTQPSEGITIFQQAHELRTDWADATSLAEDGLRYYLMIIQKNTEDYAASTSKDRSATGVVAMLED